jgi:hypothetical protein
MMNQTMSQKLMKVPFSKFWDHSCGCSSRRPHPKRVTPAQSSVRTRIEGSSASPLITTEKVKYAIARAS